MKKSRLLGAVIASILAFASLTGIPQALNLTGVSSVTTVSAASVKPGLYIVQKHWFTVNGTFYRVGQYVTISSSGAINGQEPGIAQVLVATGQIGYVHG